MTAEKKYPCPRCGSPMFKEGRRTHDKKQFWACYKQPGSFSLNRSSHDRQYCYKTVHPERPARVGNRSTPAGKQPVFTRTKGKTEVFVVTAAQNATPKHEGFYKALQTYCNHRNAQLMVIPIRYKNPTSQWTKSQEGEDVWDVPRQELLNTRLKLNRNLEILGDVKTQPTGISPLTGFEAITAGESGILGHTKLQLRTVATPQGRLPKILTTTGACTVANYTDSKAGKLGEFHHTLGAAVVEVRGGAFHLRQINADKASGAFYDLEYGYSATGVSKGAPRPLSLTLGDTHVRAVDSAVERATDEMAQVLRPLNIVWHDLCDGYSFNHHSEKNPFVAVERTAIGAASVRQEVFDALEYVALHTPSDCTSIIVPSNHNDFLQRWLHDNDWRRLDPTNRLFYLETALAMARRAGAGNGFTAEQLNAFIYWAKQRFAKAKNVQVLEYDESCMLGEIEHGLHGHQGPDGARGNLKNLRRIGVKTNSGHAHSPGIDEGAFRAGTSTRLRLGYNSGPSSWLNSHILTYANSKRTLINIINGEWRL